MRSSWAFLLVTVAAATPAGAQPYAPEYLDDPPTPLQLPSFLPDATPQETPPETPSKAPSVQDDAAQRKTDEIAEFMAADETAEPETGQRRETAAADRALTTADYLRVFAWLCVIVAVILVLGAAIRRFGKKSPLLAGANFGKILGRLYLDRNVSLHFVETAGHVLVIGVAQNAIALLASYDKQNFTKSHDVPAQEEKTESAPGEFLRQLETSAARLRAESAKSEPDPEIQALQHDITRLQRFLEEEAREFKR